MDRPPEKYEIVVGTRDLGIPRVGGKIKMKKEPPEVLARIVQDFKKGLAFMVNPDDTSKLPWIDNAKTNVGTMLLNFRVSTRGQAIFAVGYKDRSTTDILLESQADELLQLLKAEGIEATVYTIKVKSNITKMRKDIEDNMKGLNPKAHC